MWTWQIDRFGLDGLTRVERSDPQPGPGEVLVQLKAASLNYRDLLVALGHYNPKLPLPMVPLSDGAGEVVAVGPGVTTVKVRDRVAGCFMQDWPAGELTESATTSALGGAIDGVLSEFVTFRESGVVPIPDHLSDEEAATLPCAAVTAWQGVIETGLRPGESVLVMGTGGVSIFALQIAERAGARVIATSSSDEKLARVRELGGAETINYRTTPEWDRKVRELTGGRGVDHIIEVGGAGTLARSLKAVRLGGRIALIGVLAGAGAEVNPLPALMKGVRIQGIYVGNREMFERLNRFLSVHRLHPIIDRTFAVDEIAAALQYMQEGRHFGKIVLRV